MHPAAVVVVEVVVVVAVVVVVVVESFKNTDVFGGKDMQSLNVNGKTFTREVANGKKFRDQQQIQVLHQHIMHVKY